MHTAKWTDRIEKLQKPAPYQNTNELASWTSARADQADIRKVRAIPITARTQIKARTDPNEYEITKESIYRFQNRRSKKYE